jgi:hypothetical protein
MNRPVWLREARGWDHVRVHVSVLLHPDLGPYEQYLYELLAMHAEAATGEPRKGEEATQDRLAKTMGCSTRQVRRSFKLLLITKLVETYRAEQRPGRPLIFRLLPPPLAFVRVADCESGTRVADTGSEDADLLSLVADCESGIADTGSGTPDACKEVSSYTEKNETNVEEPSQPWPSAESQTAQPGQPSFAELESHPDLAAKLASLRAVAQATAPKREADRAARRARQ